MTHLTPTAPSALDVPVDAGARVELDAEARFLDERLVVGGAPRRLLHLPGASRDVLERWRRGEAVRAGEGGFARTLVLQGLVRTYRSQPFDLDELDVVIPVRDHLDTLGALLASLRDLHVTIVDDGSRDPAAIAQFAHDAGATLLRHDEPRGPAAARNAGLRASSRPLVCFVDADVALDDATAVLARLCAPFHDPLVGAVAPRVRGPRARTWREGFEERFSPLDRGPRSGLVRAGATVSFVPSALVVVRRASAGDGFDETLRVGEDVDFVWRLSDQGWLVRYEADVVVTHGARASWSGWWDQRVAYAASSAELATRHGERLAPIRVDPVTLSSLGTLLLGRAAISGRILRVAERHLAERLPASTKEPARVAREVVSRGVVHGAGPLARALVRSYAPALLALLVVPRARRRVLGLLVLGVGWRWRHERFRLRDLPLGVADDLAYASGLVVGAWRRREWRPLIPVVTSSSLRWRDFLPLGARPSPSPEPED
ncbi:MAG: mycofactocin biosynthesis glycosyltransferase MftF [Acidobacteriota bacterium]|nr:mycofactocin biosynthesis glycosyltransferase MftF [Acidobacteriota bacterium]